MPTLCQTQMKRFVAQSLVILAPKQSSEGDAMTARPGRSGRRALRVLILLILSVFSFAQAEAQRVTLRRAIELSLAHSAGIGIAVADQLRARQGLAEARNMYIPQVTLGSGLAETYGFPLSIEGAAPAVFSLNSQSFLWNPAQRDFIKAARIDWLATARLTADQRAQTVLDVALVYTQLDSADAKLKDLRDAFQTAQNVQYVTQQRIEQGIDAKIELTRANLNFARIRMRMALAQSDADLLRQQLAQLTGLPMAELETIGSSIPALPELPVDDAVKLALDNSAAVKAADEQAEAKKFRASGEHKLLRPAVDAVASYGLFTSYNNYNQFFKSFQSNNLTAGVAIRVPFLNYPQKAHAAAADAEAVRAKKEAEQTRNKVSNDTLKLQGALPQLQAAREVAQLEYELAQADVESAQAKLHLGQASLRDVENAQMEVSGKLTSVLDAQFELERGQLQLMRMTGEIEEWAKAAK
jgi:outer membrane protein TolC